MSNFEQYTAYESADVTYGTTTNQRDLERENRELRRLIHDMWGSYCWANSGYEAYLTYEQDVAIRERVRRLGIEVGS